MLMVQAYDNQGEAPEGWGSHIVASWRDFEVTQGAYRLELFTRAIEKRERPCYVQLLFSVFDRAQGVPADHTPKCHKRSLRLRVGELTGEIPPYDERWTEAYCQAVEALAVGLRGYPQVAGYWHSVGWNGESQAAVATRTGDWGAAARVVVKQQDYYDFLVGSTRRAVAAWGDKPVYVPGAPAPGAVWGTKRRDVIAECLKAGAGYLNCGLTSDSSTAFGIGERAGLGMYDIAVAAQRRGFEEGQRLDRSEPLELYWMLLNALHWRADFVNLYRSLSGPDYAKVSELLPDPDARWIVFRGAEHPVSAYYAGGKVYGYSGMPGPWAKGLVAEGVSPVRRGEGFGFDRWVLVAEEPLVLWAFDLVGRCAVTIWRPDGRQETGVYEFLDGVDGASILTLPAGEYHRVDVVALPALTLDERVTALERWVQAFERGRF